MLPVTEDQPTTNLSTQDRAALIGMAQWARLLSIVGFVSIAFLVLG